MEYGIVVTKHLEQHMGAMRSKELDGEDVEVVTDWSYIAAGVKWLVSSPEMVYSTITNPTIVFSHVRIDTEVPSMLRAFINSNIGN